MRTFRHQKHGGYPAAVAPTEAWVLLFSAVPPNRIRRNAISVEERAPPPILVNCDLCILAYQLYHQSAIWPIDPWYEILARGASNRRTLFKTAVHAWASQRQEAGYAGPASLGRVGTSNQTLDPIITNYNQISPREPTWNGDGAVFIGIKTPSYIVDSIQRASVTRYVGAWRPAWPHGIKLTAPVKEYGSGADELIAFEGGTGAFRGTEAAWSLMGFVLKRTRQDGSWTAHIVFRGSRSGNATRAVMKSGDGLINGPQGNPDWITDLASKPVNDPYVGGMVAEGFAGALKRSWGTLFSALKLLNGKYGAPAEIHVAGHSLGGALAAVCCASISTGTPGVELRRELAAWPWDAVQGYFYAVPPVATQSYCAQINGRLRGQLFAPYVKGDPVVECSKSVGISQTGGLGFAGWAMGSGGYSIGALDRLPRPGGAHSSENSHELYLIRHAIISKYCQLHLQPIPAAVRSATCWATFATFRDLLDGKAVSFVDGEAPAMINRQNLRSTLVNSGFARHFTQFLTMLKEVVENRGSYRGYHQAATLALAGERVALALEMCEHITSPQAAVVADTVATQVAALCAFSAETRLTLRGRVLKRDENGGVAMEADALLGMGFNTRIGIGLMLRALAENATITVADFERQPELEACLTVFLGDVDKWQKKKSQAQALAAT
jgi:hypothetical protein